MAHGTVPPTSVVLLVEDDADLLGAVSDGLTEDGWTVLAASSVSQALELVRTRRVDVIFSDLRPADGDGQILQHADRAVGDPVPIVFMTGLLPRGRDLAGSTVIIKPFETSQATAALRQTLSKRASAKAKPTSSTETTRLD